MHLEGGVTMLLEEYGRRRQQMDPPTKVTASAQMQPL